MRTKLLKPWANNPRRNDHVVTRVADSIEEFGWGRNIVARRSNWEIIAGHTAWKAAMQRGDEWVPVRFMDITEDKAHRYAIADNRIGELAEWDMVPLTKLLKDFDTDVGKLGWSDAELKKLNDSIDDAPEAVVEDDVPEQPSIAVTALGDLWQLGRHRLLCGDSTKSSEVSRACGDKHPFICVTAPPPELGATVLGHFKGEVAYVWCLNNASAIERELTELELEPRGQIVWRKPNFVLGRGHYQWQHELCWYSVRKGMSARWAGGRKQSTVWDIAGLGAFGASSDSADESSGHDTQKPVECFARALRNHGKAGDVVYEPFAGSGTALVAAEQLERSCVALEISPLFCDLIVERWQRLTGGRAKRV